MFPLHDPQFWLATAVFIFAAAWLLRGLLPRTKRTGTQRRVKLTISAPKARRGETQQPPAKYAPR